MYNNGRGDAQEGIIGISSPMLVNVLFSGNYAGEAGGAMYNNGHYGHASPALTNVTIAGNWAEEGAGMYNVGTYGRSRPELANVIVWQKDGIYNENAIPVIRYSDIWGAGSDPQFVAPLASSQAPTTGGDYHLRSTSPVIDAGDNSAVPTSVTTDLDGNLRFVDVPTTTDTGHGAPPIVDMGAYEVQAGPGLVGVPELLSPLHGTVTTSHAITLSWQAGDGAFPAGYNVWLGGKVITTAETTSPSVLALGVHTWTVRAYNVAGYSDWASPWSVEVTETLPVLPGTPTLLWPPHGIITTSQTITLRWQAGGGAAPTGYNVLLDDGLVTTTVTLSPTVLAWGVHTWTVRAYNTAGYSDWAAERRINLTEDMYTVYLPLVLRN